MAEDQDPIEEEGFVEIDGEKFKEDPENKGEALKDEESGEPIPFEIQSTETKPVTAEDAFNLAQALQKGYTLTRQDLARISENQVKIQEILTKLQKKEGGEFQPGEGEEEPLTVKKLLQIQKEEKEQEEGKATRIKDKIDRDIEELKIQGVIKDDKEADELLKYAVANKITDLNEAAKRWLEVKKAKEEGRKEGAKGKAKGDAGKQVGTSGKVKTGKEEKGFDYDEIHNKEMEDFTGE